MLRTQPDAAIRVVMRAECQPVRPALLVIHFGERAWITVRQAGAAGATAGAGAVTTAGGCATRGATGGPPTQPPRNVVSQGGVPQPLSAETPSITQTVASARSVAPEVSLGNATTVSPGKSPLTVPASSSPAIPNNHAVVMT